MKLAQNSGRIVTIFFLPILVIPVFILTIGWYWAFLLTPSFLFGFFLAWFFRDPERVISENENEILAPADGKIVFVEQSDSSFKLAIRMSPFNVHINRAPVSGKITKLQFLPGKKLPVYFANAEKKNARNVVEITSNKFIASLFQLSGAFARRIENWVVQGDFLQKGEKIGIIRFGSQTNLHFSSEIPITINCSKGDSVKAGITVIATFNQISKAE